MSRVVYIGGFGNGKASAEGVVEALVSERGYTDGDAFTFSQSMDMPDTIRRAVRGADAKAHSSGATALPGTRPRSIELFNAPLPVSIPRLVARTGLKTLRMHVPGIGIKSAGDILAIARYNASSVAELLSYPKSNIAQLGNIAVFNAIRSAADAQADGIPVTLGYTDDDEYFQPSSDDKLLAGMYGVDIVSIPGIHDEVVLRPAETLRRFDEAFETLSGNS